MRREQQDGHFHQPEVAGVGEGLVFQHDQQRSQQVTHALGIPLLEMGPHIRAHYVTELCEVALLLEKPVAVERLRDPSYIDIQVCQTQFHSLSKCTGKVFTQPPLLLQPFPHASCKCTAVPRPIMYIAAVSSTHIKFSDTSTHQ